MANPSIWGPNIWQTLHFISLGYPDIPNENDKEHYKNFFLLLQYVLPCKICALHYSENLKILPLTDKVLSSKNNLILWVIDLHNSVNLIKKKPILRYDDAIKIINNYSKCQHSENHHILLCLFIILIILLFVVYIYKKYI
jgi:FAD-linked sulfhydryl oxidase